MIFDVNYGAYDYTLGLCCASVFGSMTSIKALARRINRKNEDITFMRRSCTTVKNGYKVYTAKIPSSEYGHAMIYRKDTATENASQTDTRIEMTLFVNRAAGEAREPYMDLSSSEPIPQKLLDVLYAKLNGDGNFRGLASIGLLPEWMPYLAQKLVQYGCLYIPRVEKPTAEEDVSHNELFVYILSVTDSYLCNIVTSGLNEHELNIHGTNTASIKLENIHGLNDYLNEFGTILSDEVQERFTPRFTPGQDEYSKYLNDYSDYVTYNAGIMLYDAQKNVIQSAANCLSEEKFTYICSMMGTGRIAA